VNAYSLLQAMAQQKKKKNLNCGVLKMGFFISSFGRKILLNSNYDHHFLFGFWFFFFPFQLCDVAGVAIIHP
jgi:hypothetical protein